MIYIDNNEETQVIYIPRGAVKIGVTPPVSEEALSDYYTKNQVNGLLQSYPTKTETRTIANEAVKDIDLKDYYTKQEVDEKLEDVGGDAPDVYVVTCGEGTSLTMEEVKTLARRAVNNLPSRVMLDKDADWTVMDVQDGIVYVDGSNEGYMVWGLYTEFETNGSMMCYSWEFFDNDGVYDNLDENGRVPVHQGYLATDLSGYQEKLVSSENIKTVNGVSLLGYGNVNVKVPHFVFTLDMENRKANLVEGYPDHLLHLVTTSGQFTAELTLGDTCVNYLTVYKGENGTASVTFDAQDTYLSVILADEGVPYTDMPVQYVDKKTVLGITGLLAEKQDKLVSGTSIKTVNGESLLGSGDITIEGGTVDADSLERAIMDSPYISAILARVENLEDRVKDIEKNNNNMVSEL